MGNGIAHVFAQKGHEVTLIDISQAAIDKALATIAKNLDRLIAKERIDEAKKAETLANISTTNSIEEGVKDKDLVVEAATENEALKLKPENVIGMHFMNPVPIMKLVEVIRGYATSDETTAKVMEISKGLGKVPTEVNDYPGFVANRILLPMINEAIIALHEGVAGVEEIDTVMKLGMAHPMGPLQLADFIGLDVCLSILRVLQDGMGNSKYAPCPLLVNMVTAGKLGRKSGEGFYDYSGGGKDLVVSKSFV